MVGAGAHPLELLALFIIERSHQALEEDSGKADDGIQGRPQLMGHGGQKTRIGKFLAVHILITHLGRRGKNLVDTFGEGVIQGDEPLGHVGLGGDDQDVGAGILPLGKGFPFRGRRGKSREKENQQEDEE